MRVKIEIDGLCVYDADVLHMVRHMQLMGGECWHGLKGTEVVITAMNSVAAISEIVTE